MRKLNFFIFIRNLVFGFCLYWLVFSPIPSAPVNTKINNQQLNKTVYNISSGSKSQSEPKLSTRQLKNSPENSKESLNLEPKEFREMLARYFPDWDARLSIENHQAIIYSKASKKLKAYKTLNPLLKNSEKLLTDEEKFAVDYFHGRGLCEKFQDPKMFPNVLNTRQTFLKKMENQEMREEFLESYNQQKAIKEN